MSDAQQAAVDLVRSRFESAWQGEDEHAGQRWVFVKREAIVDVLRALRDDGPYEFLMDLTCVDYHGWEPPQPERFCMVYVLHSLTHNVYFRVKCWVPESDPTVDTISRLWKSAPWAEREVYDMFGVRFKGHPDLRRILMPYDYEGHPLRKDYPLQGRGERQNFPRYVK